MFFGGYNMLKLGCLGLKHWTFCIFPWVFWGSKGRHAWKQVINDLLVGSLEGCYFFGSRLQMLKCMWNLPLQKHRWKFKTQWFIGGNSEMPFLKIIDVSDVSLFLMFLAACRIAGAILWSKLCKEQILSFLFWEQVSLETYPCLSHPKFQHPTSGLSDVSYIQASDKQWAMSGPTRRGSQILLIPRHRQFPFMSSTNIGRRSKTVVKRTLSCLSAIPSHKSVLFRCRIRQGQGMEGRLRTRAWQST